MSENNMSRRNIHRGRPKKRKKGCLIFFIIIIVLLIGAGAVGAYFYNNVVNTVDVIQQSRPEEQVNLRDEDEPDPAVSRIQNKEPFSMLILGVEPSANDNLEEGQSDIMVVITVNPEEESVVMTNIPSNTLTEIVGQESEGMIREAYETGGLSTTVNTVQDLLEIPIDYTLTVNLNGLADIIDAIGEVSVTATETFDQNGYSFVTGETYNMDGEMALAYIGDIDEAIESANRQDKARQVVSAIVPQISQINSLTSIPKLLSSLNGNVLTNLSFKDIQTIALDYRQIITNVETVQLEGNSEMIDDVTYEVLDSNTLTNIQEQLKALLEE